MKIPYILFICISLKASLVFAQIPEGFVPLFNGKDLDGWHISRTSHQGTTGNFYVDNGVLTAKQNPFGQGSVLLTDKKYADFELYIEAKIDSFCNGGIFIRSTESAQAYQIELILPGKTGALLGEAMQISQSADARDMERVWKADDWNSFRIRMTGAIPTITLWINDVMMWEVTQPKNDFTAGAVSGMIGLQLHWSATYQALPGGFNMPGAWRPEGAHRFRNIGIKNLSEK
ncbi:MAG TPA: DUF1080 domain-containing protein [Chryseolinea sp.]|nr:DUF1080 domain-containing protein [Chryseolinea sp.]